MRRPLLSLLLLMLASCGSSPTTRFFALEPVAGRSPGAAPALAPVGVDDVHLPALLDRLDIVRQGSQGRVLISDRDKWGAPLDEMTRRVLAQDLASRLPPGSVVLPGAAQGQLQKAAIVIDAQEFDGDGAGNVVLEADWTLLTGSPRKAVLHRHERIEAATAAGFDAQPQAMSRALGLLADRIAAALQEPGSGA